MDPKDLPRIPGYKVLKKIGKGGMATVYLAIQERFDRKIALKIMSTHLGEDNLWAKRFIKEAQVIAQLSHPNIVPVYDVGTHDGNYYISMEYIAGGSLENKKHGDLAFAKVLKIVAGVAAGLDYAGEKGFVHRDIKPDNIMFREDGSPVILDFGIVKQKNDADSKMTQTGTVVGTATYMSPEQVQDKELDERSDIYSLGIMFYELMVGKPPFHGSAIVATMLMHVNDTAPPLPEKFEALQPIIDKALAKAQTDRYSRARELIQHIKRFENEIKSIIALENAKIAESEELTEVHHYDKDKPPAATKFNTTREHAVADEELTRVLSSAQATIKDFSAESQTKKAKRNRRFAAGLIVISLSASGFLAFQQLYLVPKERALVEQQIQQEKEKSKLKINDLILAAAEKSIGVSIANYNSVDEVLVIYRKVLVLDPENPQAMLALKSYSNLYLDNAKEELMAGNVERAEKSLSFAQQVSPGNMRINEIRKTMDESRSSIFNAQLENNKIGTLLDIARSEIENSSGFTESAYINIQQALSLDANNTDANALLKTIFSKTVEQSYSNIDSGQFSQARNNIRSLEKYDDKNTNISNLRKKLTLASALAKQSGEVNSLLKRSSKLKRSPINRSINHELRQIWGAILLIDKSNTQALNGIKDTSDFQVQLATKEIQERNLKQAKKDINTIKKYSDKHPQLAGLINDLANKTAAIDETNTLISSSKALIDSNVTGEDKRLALSKATANVKRAKRLDVENPQLETTIESLESSYILTISALIREEKTDLLNTYFEDIEDMAWPSNRLLELQVSLKNKKKSKKVFSGGF
ncbi:MAG: serine/threonine-protein kinase PpkA [Flavobacteriales bacterium]|jgi:serine/threonine-protein kinase PpkA